jgi:hypothetical protein
VYVKKVYVNDMLFVQMQSSHVCVGERERENDILLVRAQGSHVSYVCVNDILLAQTAK